MENAEHNSKTLLEKSVRFSRKEQNTDHCQKEYARSERERQRINADHSHDDRRKQLERIKSACDCDVTDECHKRERENPVKAENCSTVHTVIPSKSRAENENDEQQKRITQALDKNETKAFR